MCEIHIVTTQAQMFTRNVNIVKKRERLPVKCGKKQPVFLINELTICPYS